MERESAALQSSDVAAADDADDDGERVLVPLPALPSAASASASPAGVSGDLAQATAEAEQKTFWAAAGALAIVNVLVAVFWLAA